jgi:regulator of protease activity HflC (stomatin/prohibitin superfamily)
MSEQQEIIEIKLSDFFNFENNWVTALIVSIVVLLIIGFLYSSAFVYVKPGEYGLKQVNIGLFSKKGIQKEKYGPGLHFVMPFGFERMHKFPRTLQVLEMSSAEDNSRRSFLPAAKIQTSDGFFVDVDVSIIYRIYDSYKINNFFGLGSSYLSNGIEPKAEPILKASLGKLTVEDFYNSIKRVEMLKEA